MKEEYIIRKAGPADNEFIAGAIIAAEKGGTEKIGLCTLFALTEQEVKKLLIDILEEDIPGCEFSADSFLIIEQDGRPAGTVAGWIENFGENIPSRKLKTNLMQLTFPKDSILKAHSKSAIVKDLQVEREKDSLQIEYVYTANQYRGRGLAGHLIDQHITLALQNFPGLKKVQVQVFKNNLPAIKLYERSGFNYAHSVKSTSKEILTYLPYNEKIVMEREIAR